MDIREESYKIDENAMVLIASDVHIGALRTNISLFNDFLTNIISGIELIRGENRGKRYISICII